MGFYSVQKGPGLGHGGHVRAWQVMAGHRRAREVQGGPGRAFNNKLEFHRRKLRGEMRYQRRQEKTSEPPNL